MTVVDNGCFVDVALGRLTLRQLGTDPLVAPHLLDSEFVSAVRRYNLSKLVSDSQALRILTWFDTLVIDRHAVGEFHVRMWELRYDLTAYDATYVALAEMLDTRLLTTDARIALAPGIRCAVEVI